jgi:thioredoxin reductase (NADPH)
VSSDDGRTVEAREGMFPTLTPAQMERIKPYGHERRVADGETIFEHGTDAYRFSVVLEGAVRIVTPTDGSEIVVHGVGQFVGDVDVLAGRAGIVSGFALGATRILEVDRVRLQALVQNDTELSDLLLRAFVLRRLELISRGVSDLVLVGSRHSAQTLRLQEFLSRNGRPYQYLDVERDPTVQELLDRLHVSADDIPIVVHSGKDVLKKPTVEAVAECCGLNRLDESQVRDVIVVGAGPAGLAAAVYAASEGLDALVLEANSPGGQAGTSSKIENYLGFPTGISGQALASRAFLQAEKFGAQVSVARSAVKLGCETRPFRIGLAAGGAALARTIVIASGVQYRRPDVPDLERFSGNGVYFAATPIEATVCKAEDVIIVGGANSAGQAAVFLSGIARRVYMLVRGKGLSETMSKYLIRRIEETPNIELRTRTRIVEITGTEQIENVVVESGGERRGTLDARHVFMMTGADPNTDWLASCVVLDEKGFVKTGADITPEELKAAHWPLARSPLRLETSIPRVFAVGDVRAGSLKRVSAAVGEGAACVSLVHQVLAESLAAAAP